MTDISTNGAKVVTLDGKHAAVGGEPNPNVIATLEEMLQHAKDGRIQHLVAVFGDGVAPPNDLYVGSGEAAHVMSLIGGIDLCKHTLLTDLYEITARHTAMSN